MNSEAIRSRFPLADRVALALNFCRNKDDPITQLKAQKELCTFEEEFKDLLNKNLALNLKVKETGSLLLDPNVTHPFVRVHIVDMNTCKYLAKANPKQPGTCNRESTSLIDSRGHFTHKPVDFILPVATRFFDMRIKGQTQCTWDESFIINEPVQNLLKPNIILLFEILECNPLLIAEDSGLLNHELLYPVAWAYLRPLGTAHIHVSRSRLQLFKYRMKGDCSTQIDTRTPNVLLEFNWNHKVKYPSFLEVDLSFCNRSDSEINRKHFSRAPWEKEIGLLPYLEEELGAVRPEEMLVQTSHELDMRLKSWEKFLDLPSMLPNLR